MHLILHVKDFVIKTKSHLSFFKTLHPTKKPQLISCGFCTRGGNRTHTPERTGF